MWSAKLGNPEESNGKNKDKEAGAVGLELDQTPPVEEWLSSSGDESIKPGSVDPHNPDFNVSQELSIKQLV
jgi:hypothetical protein